VAPMRMGSSNSSRRNAPLTGLSGLYRVDMPRSISFTLRGRPAAVATAACAFDDQSTHLAS